MSRSVKPVKVSPLIKGLRWSLLGCGIVYGVKKLEIYYAYEESVAPKRHKQIKEKYEKLRRESSMRDTNEVHSVGKEFEITEFPPGWNEGI